MSPSLRWQRTAPPDPNVHRAQMNRAHQSANGSRAEPSRKPYPRPPRRPRPLQREAFSWKHGEVYRPPVARDRRPVPSAERGPAPEGTTVPLHFLQAQAEATRLAVEAGMAHVGVDDLQFVDLESLIAGHFVYAPHWGRVDGMRTLLCFREGTLRSEAQALLDQTLRTPAASGRTSSTLNRSQPRIESERRTNACFVAASSNAITFRSPRSSEMNDISLSFIFSPKC